MADIQVANSDADLSDNTLVTEENAYTITGLHTFSRSTNAPFAVVSGAAVVANLDADKLDGIQATGFVKADGTVALSANWDSGGYEIRANTFESDVATGTIPLVIASTTKCTNLNADKLDDQEGTYYLAAGNATGTLAVGKGGTGATTLTDGGVLLGSGTSAITATAVLGDGVILIGDASGDPTTLDVGSSTAITTLGTVTAGTWQSTDIGVAYGGTGVSTLTDGGVLIGNGTGDIQAMAVLADSEMIVGDGTTDPVAETGATLRTSIGCDAAGNITSGTVATARLGSGTASSGTFLRGDSSWVAVSATSAAGSDTQVQYNDGGTAFGGDAGLVYNDSTDVLTSGKLATTDTSATSIDVAGGITAGTSNIAIVNAAGKIPALSSTYLADLSGANLTGISAGPIVGYTATTANVSNSTTKTAVVTVGQIGANDWDNGDILSIAMAAIMFNNTGAGRTVTWEVDVEGNVNTVTKNWEAGSNIRYMWWYVTLIRADDEVWWGFSNDQYTRSGMNPGDGSITRITSMDFTAAIDVKVNLTFPTASTDLYWTAKSANAYLTKRTT